MTETELRRLSVVMPGNEFIIRKIQTSPATNLRLRELGFSENISIRTISNGFSRLICEVNNTRIGIDYRVANDIYVSAIE